jgi:hypothetical protein
VTRPPASQRLSDERLGLMNLGLVPRRSAATVGAHRGGYLPPAERFYETLKDDDLQGQPSICTARWSGSNPGSGTAKTPCLH